MYCDHIGPSAEGVFRIDHPLAGLSRGRRVVLGSEALRTTRRASDMKFCTACIGQAVANVTITLGRRPKAVLVMNGRRRLPPVTAPVITFDPLPKPADAAKVPLSFRRQVAEFFRQLAVTIRSAFTALYRKPT